MEALRVVLLGGSAPRRGGGVTKDWRGWAVGVPYWRPQAPHGEESGLRMPDSPRRLRMALLVVAGGASAGALAVGAGTARAERFMDV